MTDIAREIELTIKDTPMLNDRLLSVLSRANREIVRLAEHNARLEGDLLGLLSTHPTGGTVLRSGTAYPTGVDAGAALPPIGVTLRAGLSDVTLSTVPMPVESQLELLDE